MQIVPCGAMNGILKKFNSPYFFSLLILLVSAFVFLPNLGRHFLWQDEAQTALLSRSILTNGIPYGHDDKNSFSQELGAENSSRGVYQWHPWIPFYVHAVFFQLFGPSDVVARLPDALFGMGTVLLCYWIARSSGWGTRSSLLAAGMLLFMIPFLLLSRQCRYYSMAAFFSTGSTLAYFLILQSKKYARLLFVCSTAILFQTQMIYGALILATVLIHGTFAGKKNFKRMIIPVLAVVCSVMPWIWYTSGISYQSHYGQFFDSTNLDFAKKFLAEFVAQLEIYVIPIYILLFLYIILVWHRRNLREIWNGTKSSMLFYGIYTFLLLITLSIAAPNSLFRYLSPLLPLCAIVVAEIVELGFQAHPLLGSLCLLSLLVHQPLLNYGYELTHDFNGPMEGIIGYVGHHAQTTDTVAITYGDMPIKWYTHMRVIGGLTGENLDEARHARWIIIRKNFICSQGFVVTQYLRALIRRGTYRKIILNAPDTPYENREDPKKHLYRTATGVDHVVLYERVQ